MNRLLEDIGLRFSSGNSVPVERATLTRAEYDQLRALLSAQEPTAEHWRQAIRAEVSEVVISDEELRSIEQQARELAKQEAK